MATITRTAPDLTPPPVPVRRFTVEEYLKMIAVGVFVDSERLELLEGWIVPKPMTRNPPHEVAVDLIDERLRQSLPPGWRLRNQASIRTTDSVPEPDFAIVRGEARDSLSRHPIPADLALVIEVSDSTLAEDRTLKARLYARAQITAYWIVNVIDHQIEVHSDPSGAAYLERTVIGPDGEVALVLDGVEVARIAARDLLP